MISRSHSLQITLPGTSDSLSHLRKRTSSSPNESIQYRFAEEGQESELTFWIANQHLFDDNEIMWPEKLQTEQLIAQAKGGDASAVNQLMDRHRNSLRQLVRMRLDNKIQKRVDVSDVVQDVLVEANRRLERYMDNPIMPFHLWLRQIAKDRIIDAHRRHRVSAKRSVDREQQLVAPRGYDQSSIQLAALLGDSNLTPAAAALQKEMAKKVEEAIAKLEDKDCEIIVMRHYEHLSNQEIGQLLGLSEPAASMRYLRAIRRLKLVLSDGSEQGEG